MYHPYYQWTNGTGSVSGKSRVIPSLLQKEANDRLREWVIEKYQIQNKRREAEKEFVVLKSPEKKEVKVIKIRTKFVPEFRSEPVVPRRLTQQNVEPIENILASFTRQEFDVYKSTLTKKRDIEKEKIDPRAEDDEILIMLLLTV